MEGKDYINYQGLAMRTAKPLAFQPQLEHAVLGLISDWGEVVTGIKQHVVYGVSMTDPQDKKDPLGDTLLQYIVKELGDTYWFANLAFTTIHLPLSNMNIYTPLSKNLGPNGLTKLACEGAKHVGRLSSLVGQGSDVHESDFADVAGSVGRIWRTCDAVCSLLLLDPQYVLHTNIAKLRARYPDKYSDAAAVERADEKG